LGRGGAEGRPALPHVDGNFRGPTDVAFDSDDNVYISDGYTSSRVAKFDKHGNWIKSWGSRNTGGQHANENPGQFNTPHNIAIDRQNNVYVADRGNRRIQVFDRDGKFLRFIFLNAAYDKTRHPALGNVPIEGPDQRDEFLLHHQHSDASTLYGRFRNRAASTSSRSTERSWGCWVSRAAIWASSTGPTASPVHRKTKCKSPT
jgi:hypothetical protein